MREFGDMTIVPGSWFIAIDGEGYHCKPFVVADLKGNTRTIPGDRILAIQWNGQTQHGLAEGFGAGEGFFDRKQIEPYLKVWLAARAGAKRQDADALKRKHLQEQADAANHHGVISTYDAQIADLKVELAAADAARKPNVQGRLDIATRHRANLVEQMATAAKGHTKPEEIEAAKAIADKAETEIATDGA